MKILQCHNYYQQPGGEDQVFDDERRLLESHGHTVIRYVRRNDDIKAGRLLDTARRTLWNSQSYRELRELIASDRPDIMHCTNTFPLISPAAYYAARDAEVPVVQSLHNYRLTCPGGLLMREGRVCTDCLGKRVAWPAAVHGCYRGSRAGSAVIASMLSLHRYWGTWTKLVDQYIALTEFGREVFISAGLPGDRISVKPNFVDPDPTMGCGTGDFALFVGRLAPEKGVSILLRAWSLVGDRLPLIIAGDGPLASEVKQAAKHQENIRWIGSQPMAEIMRLMGEATMLVMPSTWYEGFPKTIVEAFSRGLPVVCSRLGAMQQVVDQGQTGLHVEPNAPEALAKAVLELVAQPSLIQHMRVSAREQYTQKYTAETNYRILLSIYRRAAEVRHTSTAKRPRRAAAPPVECAVGSPDR